MRKTPDLDSPEAWVIARLHLGTVKVMDEIYKSPVLREGLFSEELERYDEIGAWLGVSAKNIDAFIEWFIGKIDEMIDKSELNTVQQMLDLYAEIVNINEGEK